VDGAAEPDGALRVERHGAVATLVMERPAKRNAMTHEMWVQLAERARAIAVEPDARVLVVRGAGEHFCAGADIAGLAGVDIAAYQEANRDAETALAAFPGPTIAAIRGSCVGGGVGIATACDLRVADTSARIGVTPARLGIVYPPSSLTRLVGILGPSATKHLLFSAELIDAEPALRIGLLDEVHDVDRLDERVSTLARTMATERSALTQVATKEMVEAIVRTGAVSADLAVRWAAEAASAPDAAEGIAAFLERRHPTFTWRPRHTAVDD